MKDYLTVQEILEATGGTLLRGEAREEIRTFSTDTRTLKKGDLFIALRGPHFDGHHFVSEAFDKGAQGALLSSSSDLPRAAGAIVLQVEDTLYALGEIAGRWRGNHPIPLAAITGSTGKTTVKEWAACLLGQRYRVLSSPGTHNNQVGLPLTLLQLRKDCQAAVVELGMNARGEIHRLSQICQPDLGLITNIGPAHLEFLGSLEEVAAAKAEMLSFLGGDKTCILNGDDPYLRSLIPQAPGRCFTYGLSSEWDLSARRIQVKKEGMEFELVYGAERASLHLALWGRHNIHNALGAAAVSILLGLSVQEIGEGLRAVRPPSMRLEKSLLPREVVLVNDAYNANPASMKAALHTFFEMKGEARGILVLGDMLELGAQGEGLHREIGALLSSFNNVGALIAVGIQCRALAGEAKTRGLTAPIFLCEDQREAGLALKRSLRPGDWVLLKGSRGMKMEKILEDLI